MKTSGPMTAFALALAITLPSAVFAQDGMKQDGMKQDSMKGEITKLDEKAGTVSIKQAPAGTVGSGNEAAASKDFKVTDGLVFNAFKPGDKVTFVIGTVNGQTVITKLDKE